MNSEIYFGGMCINLSAIVRVFPVPVGPTHNTYKLKNNIIYLLPSSIKIQVHIFVSSISLIRISTELHIFISIIYYNYFWIKENIFCVQYQDQWQTRMEDFEISGFVLLIHMATLFLQYETTSPNISRSDLIINSKAFNSNLNSQRLITTHHCLW